MQLLSIERGKEWMCKSLCDGYQWDAASLLKLLSMILTLQFKLKQLMDRFKLQLKLKS